MGTKYSTNSASGYNATPPSDDGTVSEANKTKWSTVKTKLADPIKDLADTINTELVTHFNNGPVAITSNTTLAAAHYNQVIQVSGASVTLTLTDATTLGAGWYCDIISTDATNNVTLARATASDMINETSADVTILPLQALHVVVNAAANGFLVSLSPRHSKTFQASNDMTLSGALTLSGNNTISGNNTYSGISTFSGTIAGATPFVFEGATADAFETSLAITDPTADRTITIPDASISLKPVTSAELKTGTITNQFIAPDALLAALGFSAYVQTADQTITAAGALTIAHGLGRTPVLFFVFLKNTTAEFGYSIGDITPVSALNGTDAASSRGAVITADSTNIYVRYGSGPTNAFNILDKSDGTAQSATNASWSMFIRALA